MIPKCARSVDYVRTTDYSGLPLTLPRVSIAAAVSTAPRSQKQ